MIVKWYISWGSGATNIPEQFVYLDAQTSITTYMIYVFGVTLPPETP